MEAAVPRTDKYLRNAGCWQLESTIADECGRYTY
jgi:hypothetical protein